MASKTRLANKTIWALEDIIVLANDGRRAWERAQGRARKQMDPALVLALGDLSNVLARIDALAREARQGRYHAQ